MQNDVLRNTIVPWQEKGRWYHGVYDIAASALDANHTDQYIIDNMTLNTSASYVFIGPPTGSDHIHILDIVLKYLGLTAGSNQVLNLGANKYSSTDGLIKPSIAHTGFTSGTVEFWLFVVEE